MSRDYKSDSCPAEMQYFPEKLSSTSEYATFKNIKFPIGYQIDSSEI